MLNVTGELSGAVWRRGGLMVIASGFEPWPGSVH